MVKSIRLFLFYLIVALLFLGIAQGGTPENHPANVPAEAIWIGGPDGGVFVALQVKNTSRGIFLAGVYADHTGEVLYKGKLLLTPPKPVLASTRDPALFVAWDGTALLLADGRRMVIPK